MSSHPDVDVSSTSPPPAGQSRRARKHRQLVVPADTLLNFSRYHPPPRSEQDYLAPPSRSGKRPAAPRRREQFVQANYRFAVDPNYEPGYDECTALPDATIPWEAVEVIFMESAGDCPICLHPFRCPRVTPCGHAFDYVCMLQHLNHSADASGSAKCPLCSSLVRAADLKACAFRDVDVLEVGLPCAMRLVSREKGSMIAHAHSPRQHSNIPDGISLETPFYSRFAFADERYLLKMINRCINDLRDILREDVSLTPLVDSAMSELKMRKNVVRSRHSSSRRMRIQNPPLKVEVEECGNAPLARRRDLWYFYQTRDSRNIFLHPLNHRCLTTEYGRDFDQGHNNIEAIVLQIEHHTMEEKLRKRYRFLEHLPDGCEFSFVELDLSPMLSEKTLATHKGELRERQTARKRKEIAIAKEDKILERKRTESLQEYFNSHSGRIAGQPQQREHVDSRDINTFPALRMDLGSTADQSAEDSDAITEIPTTAASPAATLLWSPEISSYSSVTSNMGLFPTLGQQVPLSASSQTPGAPQGAWGSSHTGASSASPVTQEHASVQNRTTPPQEARKGKRSHGKATIVMSNAGSPYRR